MMNTTVTVVLIVLGAFTLLTLIGWLFDKEHASSRSEIEEWVRSRGGSVVDISERYNLATKRYDYTVVWRDASGGQHTMLSTTEWLFRRIVEKKD